MLRKVLETIKENSMIKAGDKVVCALSGGADSLALLYALFEIKDTFPFELYAAHLNHGIRGADADNDNLYVREVCENLGIKLFEKKVNIPHIAKIRSESEEKCGRDERYAFFDEVSASLGGAIIATGHHMNDNAETVLFNLFRGSGLKGLTGIPYKRDNIIRPLLNVTREDTQNYLKSLNVAWCEDYTNNECVYTRNNIRLVILKEIKKLFPSVVKKISDTSRILAYDEDCLNQLAKESGAFEEGVIKIEKFTPLHESIKRRAIMQALNYWQVKETDNEKIKAVYSVCTASTGKMRDIGDNIRIVNEYGKVKKVLCTPKEKLEEKITVKVGENLEIKGFGGIWTIKTVDKLQKMRDNKIMVIFDADKMGEEVTLRCREDGDYMYPAKMQGKKKIKKIFIDLKIPKEIRDTIPLLAMGNEVLFIPNVRKSGNYMADEHTKRYFVAQYQK